MTMAIVAGVVAFLVVAVVLSRQSTKTKKQAIADLEAERESVGTFDIFELIESEVRALDLTGIEGSPGIPHGVLLKIWSDSADVVESCIDRAHLRYVVPEGIDPEDATDDDVTLECMQPKMEGD
ncbi:MAG: hypothetical protein V3S28_03750 [Acidimicrobiia bacterium]